MRLSSIYIFENPGDNERGCTYLGSLGIDMKIENATPKQTNQLIFIQNHPPIDV